jgi:hypothetical protein
MEKLMSSPERRLKGAEKILVALVLFGYLTASQLTRLHYAPKSLGFVRQKLNSLVAAGFVSCLPGRFVTQPRVYTLTGTATALRQRWEWQRPNRFGRQKSGTKHEISFLSSVPWQLAMC